MRVLLLSLFSLLLLQGTFAVCLPRDTKFKIRTYSQLRARSTPHTTPASPKSVFESSPISLTKPSAPAPSTPSRANVPSPEPPVSAVSPQPSTKFTTLNVKGSTWALCNQTDNPDICMSAVQSYLPPTGEVGPKDMLIMHVNASVSKLDRAKVKAAQLLDETTIVPELRSRLETCKDSYDDAKSNFDEAVQALGSSDIDTVKVMLSAAISDVGACDDGFTELPGLSAPMTQVDNELNKFVDNCLALADLL